MMTALARPALAMVAPSSVSCAGGNAVARRNAGGASGRDARMKRRTSPTVWLRLKRATCAQATWQSVNSLFERTAAAASSEGTAFLKGSQHPLLSRVTRLDALQLDPRVN